MVNLRKFLRAYTDAGALHGLIPVRRFIDERMFLTERNQLGVVLQVAGIDDECLTEATIENYTRRIAAAWRSFDERFRIYQYVVKQDHSPLERKQHFANPAIADTVKNRDEFLRSRSHSLYSIQLFVVILLDSRTGIRFGWLRTEPAMHAVTTQLKRQQAALAGHVDSLQRTIGDLLKITVLRKAAKPVRSHRLAKPGWRSSSIASSCLVCGPIRFRSTNPCRRWAKRAMSACMTK